jgi:fructosamine-3-kinase
LSVPDEDSVGGLAVRRRSPLHGGCIAEVAKLELADGSCVVEKRRRGSGQGDLTLEAWMLDYLARHSRLPVPEVLEASSERLVLAHVPHTAGGPDRAAEVDAARRLAELHGIAQPRFGLERDTLIGPLPQANGEMIDWIAFFRERRLLAMSAVARASGRLPTEVAGRLERLAGRLESLLEPPAAPALLHGDLWAGNLLFGRGHVAAFIDPAIYFGHPEIELAFTTLFGPFGETFYAAYGEARGIAPGFFDDRADLYNLYPLLVHVRLFGAGYLPPIERTLRRHGL